MKKKNRKENENKDWEFCYNKNDKTGKKNV